MKAVNIPRTTPQLLEQSAAKYGNRIAFKTFDQELSFIDVQSKVERIAKSLLSLGLEKGDVISVQLPNSIEFALTHLAAAQIGLILNPLSPNYRQQELLYMLKHCETKALVISETYENNAYEIKNKLQKLNNIIVVGKKNYDTSIPFTNLLTNDEEASFPVVYENDPMLIMFTSGTESNPKAVLHTYETFVPTHLQNGYELKINEQDTMFCLTPLCHMFSLPMIIIGLYHGASHFIREDYDVPSIIDNFVQEQISFTVAAPAHLIDILHVVNDEQANKMNLRLILTGGTKIPSQLVKSLRTKLNSTVAAQWGMTEVCAGAFTRPNDEASKTWESVGRACPFGEVAIVDDETHELLSVGESGEIAFKGDSLFVEYYRSPELTESAFTKEGYFLTGDNGYLDEQGFLRFEGRTKDIINRGGLKYHTSEIEEALLMHPNVNQVAIVSVPDVRLGEKACAYISLRQTEDELTLEKVQSFLLDQGYAKYKLPEYIELLSELPVTSTGKINKVLLREKAETINKEYKNI